jgi:hypothetical protein
VRTSLNDTVIELNDGLNERKWEIDESLLRYCKKAVRAEGDLVDFKYTYSTIATRFEECYNLHKSLVDTIKLIQNNNN